MDYSQLISRGRQPKPMRNLIYGQEGIGKSSLAAQFPNPIFLATEDGTDHIETTRYVPTSYADALQFLAFICDEKNAKPTHGFQTLNIDTLGSFERMAIADLLKEKRVDDLSDIAYGGWKKGMAKRFDVFMNWLSAIVSRGIHVNIIGHSLVRTFNDPEGPSYDRYMLNVQVKELADAVNQWTDNIFFINRQTVIVDEKSATGMQSSERKAKATQAMIHTRRTAAFDAKTRIDTMPDSISMGKSPAEAYENFMRPYREWLGQTEPADTKQRKAS